jgi:hypothetical protein
MTILIVWLLCGLLFVLFSLPPRSQPGRFDFVVGAFKELAGYAFLAASIILFYVTFK